MAMTEPEAPGKWERAIAELARAVGEKARQPTTSQIGYYLAANVLRERLVPLLDALDQQHCSADCGHLDCTYIREEIAKWLK